MFLQDVPVEQVNNYIETPSLLSHSKWLIMCSCSVKLLSVTIFLSQKFCYSDFNYNPWTQKFYVWDWIRILPTLIKSRVSQLENYKTFSTANIAAKGISWVILFHAAFYFCMYGCRSASSSIKSRNCWLVFEFPSSIFFFFFQFGRFLWLLFRSL